MEFSNCQCCPGRYRGTHSLRNAVGLGCFVSLKSVLSRHIGSEQLVYILFVKTVQFSSSEEDVQVLWDLETLAITEIDRVYEEFVDNVTFNGNRYSVKLSWKELVTGEDNTAKAFMFY